MEETKGTTKTRSVVAESTKALIIDSQPFRETTELGGHLPYSTTRLQRLEFCQSWDALFQGARETREYFGSVDGGRTRPYAGLENGMGIVNRTLDVFGVGCVDTVHGLL